MWKFLSLSVWLFTAEARAQDSLQEVRETTQRIIPEGFDNWPKDKSLSWLDQKLTAATVPAEIYVLKREIFRIKIQQNDHKGATEVCTGMKILPDDFSFRINCVDFSEGIIPHEEAREILLQILQDARQQKRYDDAVDALNSLAWIQSQDGDISEALASYTEALELVPKENERARFNVLFNLATNFIVHGNDDYIRKGISLLTEIKQRGAERAKGADKDEAALLIADSYLAAFNIGIAYTLHLHDYAKAIDEFEYAKAAGGTTRVEALTFSALSAAVIKQHDLAKKLIAEIKGEESNNAVKEGYLKCYRALAERHWNPRNSLATCFNLNPDTTLEVVSDINRRLAELKGHPEELEGLRAHMKMYEEKIKPEYKKRAAKAASNTELKRLETEAKLKDEKIALGEKIKVLLYVVLAISFLLLGLMMIVLRSRRIIKAQAQAITQQKANLQNVLNHIDEGIVTIDRRGLISPVYSLHAMQIFAKEPDHMTLTELLSQLGLAADGLAAAHEVFGAVLGEPLLAWELNEGLLPQSGFIQGTPFLYYWSPIVTDGRITEIILSMRDASATLALQKEAHTRNRILTVVNAGAIGSNFIGNLSKRLDQVRQGISSDRTSQSLRLAHTLKGEARSLGFTELQDQLHLFEQSLLQHDLARATQIMDSIERAAEELHGTCDLLSQQDRKNNGNPVLALLQNVMSDAHKRLREAGIELVSDIHLSWVDLTPDEISTLRDILIHGVANAIDHGYLLPKKRNLTQDTLARIKVQVYLKDDDIQVSIIDHGLGIDWKALEEIAQKRNWTPSKDADLADIVFMDKVSTVAEIQVSKTSGRGLGMAAVAEAVKSLQGTIKFGPSFHHRGARLDIKWKHRASTETKENQAAS